MQSFEPKHLLNAQRQARKARIAKAAIRANNKRLLQLNEAVKPPSSASSSNTPSSYVSPALQSSQERPHPLPKTIRPSASTTRPSANGKPSANKRPKQRPDSQASPKKLSILDLDNILLTKILTPFDVPNAYVLRKWIDKEELYWDSLAVNPNSISVFDYLFEINIASFKKDNKDNGEWVIHWNKLSENPNAIELLRKRIAYVKKHTLTTLQECPQIDWFRLSGNPNAIELLKNKIKEEKTLDEDTYNRLQLPDKIDWDELCKNPNAIALLKANIPKITEYIFVNKNIDEDIITILSQKRHDLQDEIALFKTKAEEKLLNETFSTVVNWAVVSSNPKAIKLLTTKAEEEKPLIDTKFKEYQSLPYISKIDWENVSSNPKAIKLLTTKAEEEKQIRDTNYKKYLALSDTERINWNILSSSPKAISLLETKIKEEIQDEIQDEMLEKTERTSQELSEYHFDSYTCLIDPEKLSANPKALKLLEKYPKYISVKGLCSNPNAVKLIKNQVLLESKLTASAYNALPENEKINWDILSKNPCIFYETSLIKKALGPRRAPVLLKKRIY